MRRCPTAAGPRARARRIRRHERPGGTFRASLAALRGTATECRDGRALVIGPASQSPLAERLSAERFERSTSRHSQSPDRRSESCDPDKGGSSTGSCRLSCRRLPGQFEFDPWHLSNEGFAVVSCNAESQPYPERSPDSRPRLRLSHAAYLARFLQHQPHRVAQSSGPTARPAVRPDSWPGHPRPGPGRRCTQLQGRPACPQLHARPSSCSPPAAAGWAISGG